MLRPIAHCSVRHIARGALQCVAHEYALSCAARTAHAHAWHTHGACTVPGAYTRCPPRRTRMSTPSRMELEASRSYWATSGTVSRPRCCRCATGWSAMRKKEPMGLRPVLSSGPASSLGQPRPIGRQVLAGQPYRPSIPHGRTRAVGLDLAPTRERDHRLGRRVGEAARLHHSDPAEASPGGRPNASACEDTAGPIRSCGEAG